MMAYAYISGKRSGGGEGSSSGSMIMGAAHRTKPFGNFDFLFCYEFYSFQLCFSVSGNKV